MFTGIISHLGTVKSLIKTGANAELMIESPIAPAMSAGDSLAVNGACLTVINTVPSATVHHLMGETLAKTNLGRLVPASPVNLELPLRAGDAIGGHFVTGHIDGLAKVVRITGRGADQILTLSPPRDLLPLLVNQGSVALDGVSLTIASLEKDTFTVSLFPFTLEHTIFGSIKAGYPANIEVDILGKYVQRLINR